MAGSRSQKHERRALNYAVRCFGVPMLMYGVGVSHASGSTPPPPPPEPVTVSELPLPPTAPSDDIGACSLSINPHDTGCVSASASAIFSGSFMPGNNEILSMVTYAGAPASPDPGAIYSGIQIVLIKTDGATFSNGDAWKCLTCGVPATNQVGVADISSYPQSFQDGMRALAGTTILDCTPYNLADDQCTPAQLHMYPIRWNVTADGSGNGGSIRELRIHPDNVHLGFNTFAVVGGAETEYGLFGRLVFNPSPTTGLPLAPRYDLVNVTTLLPSKARDQEVVTQVPGKPSQLMINHKAITVGEFRGFSKDGTEAFYIGYPWESDNIDVFAVNLTSGAVRRPTNNPGYTDPVDSSPDDKWLVMMETYPSTRMQFMSAMRGVPPLNDMVTPAAVSSVRNNGQRRFFQPIMVDRYGERGNYQGQQLNAGDQCPGCINDPNWNGMADPRWSWDGTRVVYWQALAVPPACGGANPLPCEASTEPGGRATRIMMAQLTSRGPVTYVQPTPVSDTVQWGTSYYPGGTMPLHAFLHGGSYTLPGQAWGSATVKIRENAARTQVERVHVDYNDFSDDGLNWLTGSESVVGTAPNAYTSELLWRSHIKQNGVGYNFTNRKDTSAGGFELIINLIDPLFEATGALTSKVDHILFAQPQNGT
ncbi:MAG TPA: hypothetical protein VMB71_00395 [Acetobacteraceae bacterium]|nr:hypothetical protein [Acetobacteraceae bacterium]